jgi:hypothetical protein
MIAAILALFSVLTSAEPRNAVDISFDEAAQIALAFQARAARGVLAASEIVSLEEDPTDETHLAETRPNLFPQNEFWVDLPHSSYCVLKSDGKIRHMGLDTVHPSVTDTGNLIATNYPTRSVLGEQTVIELAKEYVAAAGWPGTYRAHGVTLEAAGNVYYDAYQVELRFVRDGATWDDEITLGIEPTTGLLRKFDHPALLPTAPANMVPAVSADQARSIMLSHLLMSKNVSDANETDPVDLEVWKPEVWRDSDNWLTEGEIAQGGRNEGMLVYQAIIARADKPWHAWCVFVDAQTGLVKLCQYVSGAGYGLKTPSSPPKAGGPSFGGWSWGIGTISIMTKPYSTTVSGADLVRTSPAKPPKSGILVYLHRGRMNVLCRFEPKTGLLWHEGSVKPIYAQPNGPLLKALRKAAALGGGITPGPSKAKGKPKR